MKRETIEAIIADVRAGRVPELSVADFPAFSEEATAGDPHIGPETLAAIAATLTEADIPTFERALAAMDEGDLAWLGFKVVYDAAAAVGNVDNEVTKKYGEVGSADGEPLVFFCNDAKEIVAARELSPRDTFQAKDVTRGPSMHIFQSHGKLPGFAAGVKNIQRGILIQLYNGIVDAAKFALLVSVILCGFWYIGSQKVNVSHIKSRTVSHNASLLLKFVITDIQSV